MVSKNRIVIVDSNIVFSALLNPKSKFTDVLLRPGSRIKFLSTSSLVVEIKAHENKIKKISGYSDSEFQFLFRLVISRIGLIDPVLISKEAIHLAEILCKNIDPDDSEFVALTEHCEAVLWTGDKILKNGLQKKGWSKFTTTNELIDL